MKNSKNRMINDEEMERSEEGIERQNNEVRETLFEPENTTINRGNEESEENGGTITNYHHPKVQKMSSKWEKYKRNHHQKHMKIYSWKM